MIKLITSARFIGEIIEDLDLSGADYIHRFYSWIEYALGQMNLSKYYSLKSKIIEINNHRGLLPCDTKYIHSVWAQGTKACGDYGLSYVNTSSSHLVGFDHKGYPISNDKISIDGYHIHSDKSNTKVLLVY